MRLLKKQKQAGQSTIEFLLVLILCISMLSLTTSIGLNYVIGYVVHYKTYQAAREYSLFDNRGDNPIIIFDQAFNQARSVFDQESLRTIGAKDGELNVNHPGLVAYEFVGLYYIYQGVISGTGLIGGQSLDLVSEAFLGKEPVRADCRCRIYETMLGTCSPNLIAEATLYDNGC